MSIGQTKPLRAKAVELDSNAADQAKKFRVSVDHWRSNHRDSSRPSTAHAAAFIHQQRRFAEILRNQNRLTFPKIKPVLCRRDTT